MEAVSLEKLKKMKTLLLNIQSRLDESIFIGTAGDGLVRIEAKGSRVFSKISIDESLLMPTEKENLGNYLLQAINTILVNIDEESRSEMEIMSSEFPATD